MSRNVRSSSVSTAAPVRVAWRCRCVLDQNLVLRDVCGARDPVPRTAMDWRKTARPRRPHVVFAGAAATPLSRAASTRQGYIDSAQTVKPSRMQVTGQDRPLRIARDARKSSDSFCFADHRSVASPVQTAPPQSPIARRAMRAVPPGGDSAGREASSAPAPHASSCPNASSW
jgi:hypothetical protein